MHFLFTVFVSLKFSLMMLEIASINPLVINRLTVAHGLLYTVCTSELQQVAINNSSHLTILDPKLPLLHEVLAKSASTDDSRSFNCAALFTINSIIPWENLRDTGVGYFSKIVLGDAERRFDFGRISEPQIVHHQWSPIDDVKRDCYLGVLLNTGEFLFLHRETLDSGNFVVKHRLLAFLFDRLNLTACRYSTDNDLVLKSKELLFLRVNCFSFGKLKSGDILLSLVHDDGTILIYTINDGFNLISTSVSEHALIVSLIWSSTSNLFYYLANDNSIYEYEVTTTTKFQNIIKIKNSSRYVISKMIACGEKLIAVDSNSVHVCKRELPPMSISLPNHSVAVGTQVLPGKKCDYVFIVYEGGKGSLIKLSKNNIELLPELTGWNNSMSSIRQRCQNVYRKEQTKAILRVFSPYLNDNVDADVLIHGASIIFNKSLLLVHSNAPQNATSHTVLSLKLFTISLVPLVEIRADIQNEFNLKSTFSFLTHMFFETLSSIPTLNKDVLDGDGAAIKAFLEKVTIWKQTYFTQTHLRLQKIKSLSSLEENLCRFFREEESIRAKQRLYSLNISILKTLTSLRYNPDSNELVMMFRDKLQSEQAQIELDVRQRLADVIIAWVGSNLMPLGDADKFVLLSLAMAAKTDNYAEIIPSEAKMTLSTDLCTESFYLNKIDGCNSSYILSKSGHGWKTCDLTFLPILDLSNGSDELESHSYLSSECQDSSIVSSLLSTINFCIYTGTRKKTIVAGT